MQDREFTAVEVRAGFGEGAGEEIGGVAYKKRLLAGERGDSATGGGEGGGEGIPADVAGEVLAAGAGEQIGDLGVAVIGAAGAGGGAGGELSPGFTVVAGDEKAVPWGGGEFGGEGGGGRGPVEGVPGGDVGGERGKGRRGGKGEWEEGFPERGSGIGGQLDVALGPAVGAAAKTAERLGVEEFVGKNDAGTGEGGGLAEGDGAGGGEGVGDVAQDAAGRLGADFDKGVGGGEGGVAEEVPGGGGDEFTKDGTGGSGGVEIGAGAAADARTGGAVVANRRVVEGKAHEGVEAQLVGRAGGTGGGLEGRKERRVGGGWRGGRREGGRRGVG